MILILLFVIVLIVLCKEILSLMVIADEETALILQIQLRSEAISINLADNLLLQFIEVNLPSLVLQILHVMV